ncbi:uncharacterized protein UTRI_04547_B [Ustilago trichophora]|uniref:Secreted protein n=1 Tax=Ustilago trichophora TaxID=86804 RepID=A0A5C3EEV0_9BASI|nr:uncharacterized protein UTRI_04547_B [Ustilago trichophora]
MTFFDRVPRFVLVHVIVLTMLASLCLTAPAFTGLSAGPSTGPPTGSSTGTSVDPFPGSSTGPKRKLQPSLATIPSGVTWDPYQPPKSFDPRTHHVELDIEGKTPYVQPRPENALRDLHNQGSWWSKWMPWSKPQPSGPVTTVKSRQDLLQALNHRSKEMYDKALTLHPVNTGRLEVIRLPGNGWDAQAFEAMQLRQKGRPFLVATADNTVLYADGKRNILKATEEETVSALTYLNYARLPTVEAPTHTRQAAPEVAAQEAGVKRSAYEEWKASRNARYPRVDEEAAVRVAQEAPAGEIVAQARPGLGWMDRLTQGAKSWFGSAYRGFRALKPV